MTQSRAMDYFLVSRRLVLVFLLINIINISKANCQTSFVYNEKLERLDYDSLLAVKGNLVFVTNSSCIGCVEYFSNEKISNNYVYFIDHLSIIDMNLKKIKGAKPNSSFFVLDDFQPNGISKTMKSPILVVNEDKQISVYDYSELDKMTDSFLARRRQFNRKLQSQRKEVEKEGL